MFKDSWWVQRCLVVLPLLWISACAPVDGDTGVVREAQADAAVKDRGWQLSRFDATAGGESFSIDAPERYTLILLADGSYRVRADCNRMQGAYRLDSEQHQLTISPGAATLAECGPDSHYAQYLSQLSDVHQFEVIRQSGQLKLVNSRGQLIFDHAKDESP